MKTMLGAQRRKAPPLPAARPARPTATALIEPRGRRTRTPRDHLVTLTLNLSPADGGHADRMHAMELARRALGGFAPAEGEPDARRFGDVLARSGTTVVGVEGSVAVPGRPGDGSIDALRAALLEAGVRVTVRELRECAEPGCIAEVLVEWNRPSQVPPGWYSHLICGKHSYKTCSKCASVYQMTSTNAAGQAPSLHCEVCGAIMIEWGSSKRWNARLVTKVESVELNGIEPSAS